MWAELGLDVVVDADHYGQGLHGMLGLALRRNPRRAHLLVSRVLGKHLPVPPGVALDAAGRLARRVAVELDGDAAPVVLGFCETATALGHAVADGLAGSVYLHTTRRAVPGTTSVLSFVESHSHATHHWLTPVDAGLLRGSRPVVLVDDELSTGDTVLGTIRTLHAYAPAPRYVVATLFDARPSVARARFDALADELGVPVGVVSLLSGTVVVPPDVARRAAAARARHAANGPGGGGVGPGRDGAGPGRERGQSRFGVQVLDVDWPAELPDGGRHGWGASESELLDKVLPTVAAELAGVLRRPDGDILLLGTEELMYVPMRIAATLSQFLGTGASASRGANVVYQSTTRSPVYPVDVAGYAIRTANTFPAPDDPSRESFVYNVAGRRYDDVVLVVDGVVGQAPRTAGDDDLGSASGAVEALRAVAPVTVVRLPAYDPDRRR